MVIMDALCTTETFMMASFGAHTNLAFVRSHNTCLTLKSIFMRASRRRLYFDRRQRWIDWHSIQRAILVKWFMVEHPNFFTIRFRNNEFSSVLYDLIIQISREYGCFAYFGIELEITIASPSDFDVHEEEREWPRDWYWLFVKAAISGICFGKEYLDAAHVVVPSCDF